MSGYAVILTFIWTKFGQELGVSHLKLSNQETYGVGMPDFDESQIEVTELRNRRLEP